MTAQRVAPRDSVIQAAGGVLHRRTSAGDEVMIIHRKRYDEWALPKGKLRAGESFLDAALREVEEETGCSCRAAEYLGAIGYEVKGVPKVVLFWRMTVVQENPLPENDETDRAIWLPLQDARQRLAHELERGLLSQAMHLFQH